MIRTAVRASPHLPCVPAPARSPQGNSSQVIHLAGVSCGSDVQSHLHRRAPGARVPLCGTPASLYSIPSNSSSTFTYLTTTGTIATTKAVPFEVQNMGSSILFLNSVTVWLLPAASGQDTRVMVSCAPSPDDFPRARLWRELH